MAFRQFDFECRKCEERHTDLIEVPVGEPTPRIVQLECKVCGIAPHLRLVSAPAAYTYDRPYAPIVYGGKFDTAGWRKPPELVKPPPGKEFDKARDYIHGASRLERVRERMDLFQQNQAKRARLKAIKSGANIDLRTHPLPGDPPLERVMKAKRKGA